jgi:hypothetical protein
VTVKLVKRMVAGLLNITALSVLLLGSCAVPGGAYYHSPRWFLEEIDPEVPATSFFVALRSEGGERNQSIEVMEFEPKTMRYTDV